MSRSLRIIILILITLLVAGTILYPKIKPFLAARLTKQPAAAEAPRRGGGQQRLLASGYIINPVKMSDQIIQTGTLRPDEEVDLSFETSGKIVAINFIEGTRVKKGDLLAKINDRPLQAQLEKLLAQQKLAESKEFRQRSLLGRDAISQESYDQIETELQTIQADINLVRARISETELRAPFDGIIGLRYLSEGAYATPSVKIARLVKIIPMKIEFSVSEKYASEIRIGFPVTFSIDADTNTYKASVYAVDPKIDIDTRTIVLRALYPNSREELKPGTFAHITLLLSQIDDAIAIPTEALISEMEGEKVFVYKSGRAHGVPVKIGLRTESLIQITDGIDYGDTLMVTGILQLRESLPVQLDTVFNVR